VRGQVAQEGRDASSISIADLHAERKSAEEIEFSLDVPRELATAAKRARRSQA
jgi:hypothetical protein